MELTALLFSLAALPLAMSETVLGVYIFSRHGDRTPKALAPANLTSLGADEVYSSGNYYRSRYVDSNATSPIFGLSSDIAVAGQMTVTAPADAVLQNSAQAFMSGLYPPVGALSTQALANDSSVESPLGGYQYIPINTVSTASSSADSENSAWLQGNSGCGNAVVSSNNYFLSSEYTSTFDDTKSFYSDLLPVINSTFDAKQATFKNAYTIFDYVHVATIHNSTIPSSDLLTNETLTQLQLLANAHEWGLAYNSTDTIRAVAGSTLAAQIVQQLNSTLNSKSAQPFGIQFGAYASFLSFFGLAQLQNVSAEFTGIVDYAAAMTFELVTNATVSGSEYPSPDDVSVRFLFANGTAAQIEPRAYPLFGQSETLLPWNTFASEMGKFAIGTTAEWCQACGNTTGQCASSTSTDSGGGDAAASSTSGKGNGISLPVAGVIGALVTLVVILGAEAAIYAISGLRLVKKSTLAQAGSGAGITTAGAKA
ncbi:Uu.00g014560.m01.CDS01 [Anthostomella pinea]|uniref:Uu.00g014560.m01.CDS01 n=1 Tax=Anthostomella pinea TaxID=933095 RepID=A0AAI8YN37_9PEZI|nr:Uu.00g014560.m01.CDS01 [Anthostomella pinea]